MSVPAPPILTCPQWGARKPKGRIQVTGRPKRIIIHHTAGHAASGDVSKRHEKDVADGYARALQWDMQNRRGWIDSGHNFLVMRSGLILQGRWGTVSAIQQGRMVVSAHCPGQNDQPGIEHEHVTGEQMTPAQYLRSVMLQAWIMSHTGMRPTDIFGHRDFYNTACPDNLENELNQMRLDVAGYLTLHGYARARLLAAITARYSVRHETRHH